MINFSNALLLSSIFITGCSSVPEYRQGLMAKTVIHASFSEVLFQPMRLSETYGISLDSDQPVFEFTEGKSFYAGRAIPKAPSVRQLIFKTCLSSQYLPKANVLVPHFLFLDDSKQPVGRAKTPLLMQVDEFWRGICYEGEIGIPSAASYFVLFTSDEENPKVFSVSQTGHVRLVPHTPVGTVEVKVTAPGNAR